MKTYQGHLDVEGVGRVTVQSASGDISPLTPGEGYDWDWGNPRCTNLAYYLFLDALGVHATGDICMAFVKARLSKIDSGSPFSIDWYEVKDFYEAHGGEMPSS